MAPAGCSGSSSAKRWHWLSGLLTFGFLATNPNIRLKNRKNKDLQIKCLYIYIYTVSIEVETI